MILYESCRWNTALSLHSMIKMLFCHFKCFTLYEWNQTKTISDYSNDLNAWTSKHKFAQSILKEHFRIRIATVCFRTFSLKERVIASSEEIYFSAWAGSKCTPNVKQGCFRFRLNFYFYPKSKYFYLLLFINKITLQIIGNRYFIFPHVYQLCSISPNCEDFVSPPKVEPEFNIFATSSTWLRRGRYFELSGCGTTRMMISEAGTSRTNEHLVEKKKNLLNSFC
jgi:hypothetical protein